MSNPTTPFSWQMPENTDLVTDLPADFEVFGQAVATSMQDLLGGTTGQLLSKTSNTDMDFTWTTPNAGDITGVTAGVGISGGGTSGTVTVTNDMATTITAAGDIVIGTGSGTYDNLPIGTSNQILTADTTVSPYKVKWAAPASSSPANAQTTVDANESTTSTSFTGFTTATAVTLTTGTKALVIIGSIQMNQNTADGVNTVSFAVSGATTSAATDNRGFRLIPSGTSTPKISGSRVFLMTGLTAGSNTFTMQHKASEGTSSSSGRNIAVIDMGS